MPALEGHNILTVSLLLQRLVRAGAIVGLPYHDLENCQSQHRLL